MSSWLPSGTDQKLQKALDPPYLDEPIKCHLKRDRIDFIWAGTPGVAVTGKLKPTDSGLAFTELLIRPLGDNEITTSTLRAVPLGRILQIVQAQLAHLEAVDDAAAAFGARRRPKWERAIAEKANQPRPRLGRPSLTDDHLRMVAETLLDELSHGPARGVHQRLADRLSKEVGRVLSPDTVRDWVRVARKHDWLAATKQGRPGAEPGSRLLQARKEDQ